MAQLPPGFGTYINPFADNREGFQALTGISNFGGFKGSNYNPLLGQKTAVSAEVKAARAQLKAGTGQARFNLGQWNIASYDGPRDTVSAAMNDLSNAITQLTGLQCMFDRAGYLAYQITDKYGNDSFSTNLARLRRLLSKGSLNDDGPGIPVTGNFPSRDSLAVTTNRVWGVVISWHKLLNATKSYSNQYRANGIIFNYNKFANNKITNLTNKLYYYARNPAELAKYQTKTQQAITKLTARYNNRYQLINGVVQGLIEPQQAAAVAVQAQNQGVPNPPAVVNNNNNNAIDVEPNT